MMDLCSIELNMDEALVLFEFFQRFDGTGSLMFEHAAEYLALMRISAQIDKATPLPFDPDYSDKLSVARARVSRGFEGEVPNLRPDA